MAKNQTVFYATALDLGSVLSVLEATKPIQYTTTGLFKTKVPRTYSSFTDIPDFGRAIYPTAVANPSYLLSIQGTQISVCVLIRYLQVWRIPSERLTTSNADMRPWQHVLLLLRELACGEVK